MEADPFMPHLFQEKFRQGSDLFSEYLLKAMSFEKVPLLFLFDTYVRLIYTSMVLDVDRRENLIYLDSLHPEIGNNHLVQGSPVTFSGKAKGIEAGFRAHVRGGTTMNGHKAVSLSFPYETYYAQRRCALRVMTPPTTPLVTVTRVSGGQEIVRPVNLGCGGMRVLLAEKNDQGEPNDLFRVGDTVLIERLEFDGFRLPPLSGRVVYLEHSGREQGTETMAMGIFFLDFPKEYEEPLISYIIKMDRESLKNIRFDPRG